MAEGSPVGVPVTTVKASDPERGVVYYSIVDGNFGGSFSVDQETGTVFVVGRLDRESKDSYNLTLKASDSGDLVRKTHRHTRSHIYKIQCLYKEKND